MKFQIAVGAVVLPFWPSAYYWPLLTNKYLKYSIEIGNESLTRHRNINSLLGSKDFKGHIISLRMEFSWLDLLLVTSGGGRTFPAYLLWLVSIVSLGFWLFLVAAPVTLLFLGTGHIRSRATAPVWNVRILISSDFVRIGPIGGWHWLLVQLLLRPICRWEIRINAFRSLSETKLNEGSFIKSDEVSQICCCRGSVLYPIWHSFEWVWCMN